MSCSGLVLNLKDYAWLLEAFPVSAVVGTDAYNVSLLLENFHVSGNGSPGDASLLCQGRGCFCDIFCVIERYQLYDKALSISQFICDIICDIICVTTEPWRKRLGEANGQIDIPAVLFHRVKNPEQFCRRDHNGGCWEMLRVSRDHR